jgi:outer membrane protein OmpA-like peptidoglycan-associated protein
MVLAGLDNSPIRRLRGGVSYPPQITEKFTDAELARIASGVNAIEYSLTASDSAGTQKSSPTGKLPIRIERERNVTFVGGDTEPAAVVLFEFDRSSLTPQARTVLAELRSHLPEGAELEVIGYADETGSSDYNLKLSLARARAVAQALKGFNVSTEGAGENTVRYPNNSPEGRFYSRSATIVVK